MKKLMLLRHAKSDWSDAVTPDVKRSLNQRGVLAATAIGKEIGAQGLTFDAVIASPATRVVETLEEVAKAYGRPMSPSFDERVYLASTETLLELVRATSDEVETLLVVGHNPGLENLLHRLTASKSKAGSETMPYPTAGLAEISLPIEHWSDAGEVPGTLVQFIRPSRLDPGLGPDEG